ncbi:hypothetical protein HanHA89_Chr17g0686321 [Helianthus annuus]|nr:hypothetical protein HanHA89_Chr17g0686321 [Helianthus annuus]
MNGFIVQITVWHCCYLDMIYLIMLCLVLMGILVFTVLVLSSDWDRKSHSLTSALTFSSDPFKHSLEMP